MRNSTESTKSEPKRGQARATFADVVNEEATHERVRELVDQALSLNGLTYGHCSECGGRVQVEVPDVKKRVDALIALLEQAEGKPIGDGPAGVTIIVERVPLRDGQEGTRTVWPHPGERPPRPS
jgi:hypothetical protein